MSEQATRVALLGYPLGHSVSPAMHHAAASALSISLQYERQPVEPDGLALAVAALRSDEWLGANVTLPHKPAMLALVDDISPLAARIGAINTVYKREARLIGANTDAPALVRSLAESLDLQPSEEQVLVLGAGGAARAVIVALVDAGVPRIAVANRTGDRARAMIAELRAASAVAAGSVGMVEWSAVPQNLAAATLLVNATSVGLDGATSPLAELSMRKGARVYDLVYGAEQTPLVRQARAAGLNAVDGLWMLVYQAALAFELWTDRLPSATVMYEAARQALLVRPVRLGDRHSARGPVT